VGRRGALAAGADERPPQPPPELINEPSQSTREPKEREQAQLKVQAHLLREEIPSTTTAPDEEQRRKRSEKPGGSSIISKGEGGCCCWITE